MKLFKISEIFIKAIKNQAINSENEIYGWLLGYEKEDIPHILTIFECKSFDHQTLISAVPNAQEFQELSSLMPQGIGPIGIYHSHPFSSEVFHSHTDDSTLISLSNQFRNCISIVTNGREISFYQMGKNKKTKEIKPKFDQSEVLNYFMLKFEEEIAIEIDERILDDNIDLSNLNVKIVNRIRYYYEKIWKDLQFIINGKPIEKNDRVNSFLPEKDKTLYISLSFGAINSKNKKADIILTNRGIDKINSNEFIHFKLKIKTELPIYLKHENIRFEQLDDSIRTELLSNNILRKVYDSVIDFNKKEVILPEDYFLQYFGFLIRLTFFKEPSYNEEKLSKKNKELIYKLISQFNTFIDLDLPESYKNFIMRFLTEVKEFSSRFSWYEKVNNQIKILSSNLMLK